MSTSTVGHRAYTFGEFTLDVDRGAVISAGDDVKLRPQAFEVLCYLVERHGRLVSKDQLIEAIWGRTAVTDDAVTHCLIDIRKALKDSDHSKIRTVPRRGYIFELPVVASNVAEPAPGAWAGSAAVRRWPYAGILAALLIAAAAWWMLHATELRSLDTGRAGVATEVPSIAVLPFVDMSEEQDQAYFADGVSEEIINLLAHVNELRVIARTSSFSFKDRRVDIAEIARQLGVSHVLEGSVRKSGEQVRITAQLVDATTSEHLWSETYNRELGDIFAIQDDIAEVVVGELENRLVDRLQASRRTTPEVYTLFLQARNLIRTGAGSLDLAESLLRRALEIDPDYAPAWTTLGLVVYFQTSSDEDTSWARYGRRQGEQLGKTALETAYALDPADGLANAYYGWRLFFNRNDIEGVRMQEFAVASEPGNAEVLRVSGAFARYLGQWDDAISLGQRAVERDPLCEMCYWNLAYTYIFAGRLEEAEAIARKSTTLFERGWYNLGVALLLEGDAKAALHAFDQLQKNETDEWLWWHGRALALYSLGRTDEAREYLSAFVAASGNHVPRLISAAQLYAWMGENDKAFETLDRNSHFNPEYRRATFLTGAAWHPLYRNLHDDPRWQAYWELAQTTPEELQAIELQVDLPAK